MEAEKKPVNYADLVITLIIACTCVYMLIAAAPYQLLGQLFPRVIAGATLVACVAQIFLTLTGKSKVKKSDAPASNNYLLVVGIVAVYLILLNFLGFILCTLALTIAVPLVLGFSNKKVILAISFILTFASYFIFKVFFFVPLPQGILTFI